MERTLQLDRGLENRVTNDQFVFVPHPCSALQDVGPQTTKPGPFLAQAEILRYGLNHRWSLRAKLEEKRLLYKNKLDKCFIN